MAVVVNEFEVVPAQEQAPPQPTATPEPPSGPLTAASLREEIERTLRIRDARSARLEAC